MSKNFVAYRFLHETDDSLKRIEFSGDSISVADIKILIAKASGLEREFARTFDLRVCLHTGESTPPKEFTSDTDEILAHTTVIVQRVPWRKRLALEHVAGSEPPPPSTTTGAAALRPFPPEYLCPLCRGILSHPVVLRCESKCGKSACRHCVETRFTKERVCPFCQGTVQNVVPNKALAAIISKLALEEFETRPFQPSEATGSTDPLAVPLSQNSIVTTAPSLVSQYGVSAATQPQHAPQGLVTANEGKPEETPSNDHSVALTEVKAESTAVTSGPAVQSLEQWLVTHIPTTGGAATAAPELTSLPPSGNHATHDPTPSWKPTVPKPLVPESSASSQAFVSEPCPFQTTNDIACLFPLLSKKDFHVLRAFQRQLKGLLQAAQAVSSASIENEHVPPS